MGVRFVVGRAGSGKTAWIRRQVIQACAEDPLGKPVFLIVPRQATFQVERDLLCASGLGAIFRARVTSFDLLGRDILAECGGDAIPQIDALGRRMILGHLLRRHQDELVFFRSVARQTGLAARLDATLGEMERTGRTIDELVGALHQAPDADGNTDALSAKLSDLRIIFHAYDAYLGQDRLDPHRRLQHVLSCVDRSPSLRGARVFIDDIDDFTDYERRVIAAMSGICQEVNIAMLMDPASAVLQNVHQFPSELSPFYRAEMGYRRLRIFLESEHVSIESVQVLERGHTPENGLCADELERIERGLFEQTPLAPTPVATPRTVKLIQSPDRRAEVDAVAREVRKLVAEGLRLRDIVVLSRDPNHYLDAIDASFAEHGIAYFADHRRPVIHHPLMQLWRAAISIAETGWSHQACMSALKSGLSGLDDGQVDLVENYCLAHGVHGRDAWLNPEAWIYGSRPRREAEDASPPSEIDLVVDQSRRKFAEPISAFVTAVTAPAATVRDRVAAIYQLFDAMGVRQKLSQWIQIAAEHDRHEERSEHEQTWAVLGELADQLVALLGDECVSLPEFTGIVESALESFDLALIPQTVDQVLVGSVDRTRTLPVKVTIIMGLNAGVFPRQPHEDVVVTDEERQTFEKLKVGFGASSRRQVLDENFLAYRAFTRASEQLILTRPMTDSEGRVTAPSSYWDRVRQLLDRSEDDVLTTGVDQVEQIDTPRQLISRLMRWARQKPDDALGDPTCAALYQWVSTRQPAINSEEDKAADRGYRSIDTMLRLAWPALSYDNRAALDPAVAIELWGESLDTSGSQVESFAKCPFQHFARYGLRLAERGNSQVGPREISTICHRVLDRMVRQLKAARQDWAELGDDDEWTMIDRLSEQVGGALRQQIMLTDARNRYLLARTRKALSLVGQNQRAQLQRSTFRPLGTSISFGEQGGLPPYELTTPKGRTVRVSGYIDRVDQARSDGQLLVAAIDYARRDAKASLQEAYYGLSLQLLVYLVVLRQHGERLFNEPVEPAGAFGLKLFRGLESIEHPDDASDPQTPEFRLKNKLRGVLDERFVQYFDTQLQPGKDSKVIHARINTDGAIGKKTDALDPKVFAALLAHAESAIAGEADEILDGHIEVHPYRLNDKSPCAYCSYRSVCRFDPNINGYKHLPPIEVNDLKERLRQEDANAR